MSERQRPPLSPEAAAVVRAMAAGRLSGSRTGSSLSRRSLLSGAGALGVGAFLAACGTGTGGTASPSGSAAASLPGGTAGAQASGTPLSGPSPATDISDTDKVVRWANWTLYLDFDDATKKYPSLEAFTTKTGIKATYAEDIDDNETYYGKIQAQLRQGQDIGKDVITLTDWMAARVIKAGWTQKLDQQNIPNGKNIRAALKGSNVAWDPNRDYSYTWQSGLTGFGFNVAELKKLTGKTEIRTLDELWDPRLKGRVEVLSEMRDTMGIILQSKNVDISKGITDAQWSDALAVLETNLANGQIRQVKGNSYKEDLVSKDAVAVIGWSGDIFQLILEAQATNPDAKPYDFALPESGGMLWSDNLMVPVGSPHKKNAETLINYYYDPAVAAEVANYVNYICPVEGAQAEWTKNKNLDPALASSEYIFPSDDTLKKVKLFPALDAAQETSFSESFQKVLGN